MSTQKIEEVKGLPSKTLLLGSEDEASNAGRKLKDKKLSYNN
jgi:hypothetical protein